VLPACSAFRELIDDGKTGRLVGRDAELVVAMGEIAGDAALRARLGDAGFERAISRCNWQRVADSVGTVPSDRS
jgi:glycosyltransferase involved in cell wall biosynthesis